MLKYKKDVIELEGVKYYVLVVTRYGITIESVDSGEVLFHTPIFKSELSDTTNIKIKEERNNST